MAVLQVQAGQIWQDDCYYLDRLTGECKRKYRLVLAVAPKSGDCLTAVFTSKPNGLPDHPACQLGPPRAGFFVGVPGGKLNVETWVDFSSLQTLDLADIQGFVASGRALLLKQTLAAAQFCAVLRCVLQHDDLELRQARWVGDTAAALGCD